MSQTERVAHHAKVKQWFMTPQKCKAAIEAEQNKHPGKCIYHLSKSHPTISCSIKKECDKLLAEQKASASVSNSTSGQLHNIKEDSSVQDEIADDTADLVSDEPEPNDTNEANLFYFARLKNHYLCLAKNIESTPSRHDMRYPTIANSGANFHMFKEAEFFEFIIPATGSVTLGDGTKKIPIKGIGTIRCNIGSNTLVLENVRYVPSLAESVYSLLIHIKQKHYSLHSSYDSGLHLVFPHLQAKALGGKDDIYIQATPHADNSPDLTYLNLPEDQCFGSLSACCRNISSFDIELSKSPNILQSLCQYYTVIKTKRQLNLNVPAGYRSASDLQKQFRSFTPPRKARSGDHGTSSQANSSILSSSSLVESVADVSHLATDQTSPANVPILRCVDKLSSTLPSRITLTEDLIHASVGFRRINLSSLY